MDGEEPAEGEGELCPVCGEIAEDGDRGYCWRCDAHICPICNHPCKVRHHGTRCAHYVITQDGEFGDVDDEKGRDNGLLQTLDNPLTDVQLNHLQALSEEQIKRHFGSDSVIGRSMTLSDFVVQNIPQTGATYQDGPGWMMVYFHEAGGESAWERFVPILQQQKTGRDWLNEQVSD